jgi:exodeoxyribonuclease VII large subunit
MAGEVFTVRALVEELTATVTARFGGAVWVEGAVAEMSRSRNGHVYFDLVDCDDDGRPVARLSVVLWASVRDNVNRILRRVGSIRIDDGVRIRISGRLDVYAPKGQLQLVMQGIDPSYTLGLLASERERVRQLLEAEGLLHLNRQLPLPVLPLRVGLVTAAGSAAEADVLETLADSGLAWQVVQVDARVQGVGSEREVAAALLSAALAGVDVVCLVRGGGARNDLATFDHELVARTIAGLTVPVFAGIGHETDQSVADLVAHRAERTPTACATALVAHARAGSDRAEAAWAGIADRAAEAVDAAERDTAERARHVRRAVTGRVQGEHHRVDAAAGLLRRSAPHALARATSRVERSAGHVEAAGRAHLRAHGHRLDVAAATVAASVPRAVRHAERHLDTLESRVGALDPRRALARGWSITRTGTGTVVRSTADVAAGDTLVTTLVDGRVVGTVAATEPHAVAPEDEPDAR